MSRKDETITPTRDTQDTLSPPTRADEDIYQAEIATEKVDIILETVPEGEIITEKVQELVEDVLKQELAFQDAQYKSGVAELTEEPRVVPGKIPRRPSSENISLDAYVAKYKAGFDSVLALEKPDGWTLKCEEEGVKVFTRAEEGQDFHFFKGETEVRFEKPGIGGMIELIFEILKTEERPKWDETCKLGDVPQFYPPFYKYGYVQLHGKLGMISARDLLTLGRLRFEPDGGVTIWIESGDDSPASSAYPQRSDHVRVKFINGGYIFRPTADPCVCKVTWAGCVDPKGWIPVWLANLMVKKQALSLAKVKKHVEARKK